MGGTPAVMLDAVFVAGVLEGFEGRSAKWWGVWRTGSSQLPTSCYLRSFYWASEELENLISVVK